MTTTAAPSAEDVAVAGATCLRLRSSPLRVPMPDDRLAGWLGPLLVTTIAGFLRFWRLDRPHAFVFDETYYAKDAWTLIHAGAEQNWADKADQRILADSGERWLETPSYVVHPPVGKLMIGAGEAVFGFTPFGWRVVVAVVGTLSVLVLARAARRLFRSTLLGCTAGLLMALDGLHFVHSRTALLDLILMFWALVAFACLLVDRDVTRARLADAVESGTLSGGRFGPRLGWRPWRLAAGVCLGLSAGSKWSGLYFVAAFGLMSWAWDMGARRAAGMRARPAAAVALASPVAALAAFLLTTRRDAVPGAVAIVLLAVVAGVLVAQRVRLRDVLAAYAHGAAAVGSLVLLPAAVYLLSWSGWLFADRSRVYNGTSAAATQAREGLASLIPGRLWALADYHEQMWNFHRSLESFHSYASNPWSWPILARPVSFFYEGPKQGEQGCTVTSCSRAVTALGTPLLWWTALLAAFVVLAMWLGRRDWRAGAITLGLAAGYLPWFAFQSRTIYSFYAIAFVPWLVLAVTYCLGLTLGGSGAGERRRVWGAAAVGTYVCLVVGNFAWLYPVLTAELIPYSGWVDRMWLGSWI